MDGQKTPKKLYFGICDEHADVFLMYSTSQRPNDREITKIRLVQTTNDDALEHIVSITETFEEFLTIRKSDFSCEYIQSHMPDAIEKIYDLVKSKNKIMVSHNSSPEDKTEEFKTWYHGTVKNESE